MPFTRGMCTKANINVRHVHNAILIYQYAKHYLVQLICLNMLKIILRGIYIWIASKRWGWAGGWDVGIGFTLKFTTYITMIWRHVIYIEILVKFQNLLFFSRIHCNQTFDLFYTVSSSSSNNKHNKKKHFHGCLLSTDLLIGHRFSSDCGLELSMYILTDMGTCLSPRFYTNIYHKVGWFYQVKIFCATLTRNCRHFDEIVILCCTGVAKTNTFCAEKTHTFV